MNTRRRSRGGAQPYRATHADTPNTRQPAPKWLQSTGNQFLQFDDIGRKLANTFRSLVDCHRIFIEIKAKSLFVERDLFGLRGLSDFRRELPLYRILRFTEFFQ